MPDPGPGPPASREPPQGSGTMSRSLSFVELINLAIGTPELGNVNFNALHLFLSSLVEHLRLQDARRDVSAEELEFIKPPPSSGASAATSATETLPAVQKSSSIFHQMQERITAIEKQLRFLNEPPDTAELLARSQGMGQPALDMWQMMQLKKKMEVNEEGMTKVTPLALPFTSRQQDPKAHHLQASSQRSAGHPRLEFPGPLLPFGQRGPQIENPLLGE